MTMTVTSNVMSCRLIEFVQVAAIVYAIHSAWVESTEPLRRELQVGARPSGGGMPCMQIVGNLKFGEAAHVD
jgi:hypothetical protein